MPRFVFAATEVGKGKITGDEAHHVLRVHRHKVGDTIAVADGSALYVARISAVEGGEVWLDLGEAMPSKESPLRVTLYQGLLKADLFDYTIVKAVELGVHSIVPLLCERTVVRLTQAKAHEKVSRWQRLAAEAAKQCGRAVVPIVHPPLPLPEAWHNETASLKLIAYEGGGHPLKEALRGPGAHSSVACVIGTEGGFSTEEVAMAKHYGFLPVTLGPRILRAETAPLALLSVIMYELGDLG
ncbi:MAG: 16S rRNA (uracil(1498)-N(3))-methyltransferase [Firmicutes bacterium]|nr:16S rRNA (uracil(1498)-N(3))-methyltransferase [Dethiobacter sp.]MBS3889455.1 16S rRNA (uracil(1498)-N(3))-methyltransferase [Bacillota bacterium]MBS4054853.1 16S rRNA (uracil(1498)-N(3))-methyltransferase [Thermaerobacter sp.]